MLLSRLSLKLWIALLALGLVAGGAIVAWKGFAVRPDITVVLFETDDPLSLRADTIDPLLSINVRDITSDRALRFVADPFLFRRGETTFVFYELLYRAPKKGVIAVSRIDADGRVEHLGSVLEETMHLSYPLVFEHAGEVWMLPESWQAGEIRLYRAEVFPDQWVLDSVLVDDGTWVDPTLLQHAGRWWLFATDRYDYGSLELWIADAPSGPWQRHPASPVVRDDPNRARPGGRFVRDGERLFRVGQDTHPRYGVGVGLYEVTELSEVAYSESASPALYLTASGAGWNEDGMHHLDIQRVGGRWLGVADGHVDRLEWVATPFD